MISSPPNRLRPLPFAGSGCAAILLSATAFAAGPGVDCNGNGVDDAIDIAKGVSADCQGDGVPDECQTSDSVVYAYDSGPSRTLGGVTPTLGALTRFVAAGVFPFVGGVEFEGLDVPTGTPVGGGLWSDPNGDGDPSDAVLLASSEISQPDSGIGRIVFDQGVDVGGDGASFFVGIWFEGVPGGRFGFDETSVARQSWRLSTGKIFDPSAIDSMVIESAGDGCEGCDGDWVVRAVACDQPWCATSVDFDGDGVPDECEDDCNANLIPDDYEIAEGLVTDCDGNSVPDDCQDLSDCDGDGLLDECGLVAGAGLETRYWLNPDRLGPPDLLVITPDIDFDREAGSEIPEGFVDFYSMEWTGAITAPTSGDYRLRMSADDRFRLWLDGRLVLGEDGNPANDGSGSGDKIVTFVAGQPVAFRAIYQEDGGNERATLWWTPPGGDEVVVPPSAFTPEVDRNLDGRVDLCEFGDCDANGIPDNIDLQTGGDCNGDAVLDVCQSELDCDGDLVPDECLDIDLGGEGLAGAYFSCPSPGVYGDFILARVDPEIFFDWGSGSPDPAIPTDRFAVRWTGTLVSESSGIHRFRLNHDDGARVYIDGEQVVDSWTDSGSGQNEFDLDFNGRVGSADRRGIVIEYYENGGGANVRFRWRPPGETEFVAVPSSLLRPLVDVDGDGVSDACTPDCDGDGISDLIEIDLGFELDCNGNGIPDSCDLAFIADDDVVAWWRFEPGSPIGTDSGPYGLDLDPSAVAPSAEAPVAEIPRTGDADEGSVAVDFSGRLVTLDPDRRLSLVTEAFTAEAWVRLDELATDASTPAQRQWLLQRKNPTSDGRIEWAFLVQAGNIHEVCDYGIFGDGPFPTGRQLAVVLGTGNAEGGRKWCVLSRLQIEDTGWHHVSMAWDPLRTEVRFELDGEVDVQQFTNQGLNPNAHRFAVGAHVNDSGSWNQGVRGLVDEVRIRRGIVPLDEMLDRVFDAASADEDGDGVPDECAGPDCAGDFNDDGVVDGADLGTLFSAWGGDGPADLNEDGVVDGADLGTLFSLWGPCR